jgi:eukaryotic-like serine/threonine-protein kinase
MDPSRWRRVEDLYHSASDLPAAERQAYLSRACHGDEDLHREVEELLQQSDAPPGILDQPIRELLEQPVLEAGQALGPYRIQGLIGSGGMGRVYRALDTRLGRTVAIKVSRAGFTGRFRREARAVAALNHPHICTLYDLGPNYLVMEHVEGAPLQGPMPLPRVLQVAIDIAGALDAAHRRGVVHRDLKPANILLTDSGPKLLDFGLAKLETSPGGGHLDSTSLMSAAQPAIAGTLQYMSPEQLQGKPVDHRSDIFSFGVVLFYMLTGRAAFEADNAASLIAEILTARPRLRALVPNVPAEVVRVIDRALAKKPEDRWQSARDVKAALERIAAPPPVAPPRERPNRAAWTIAALLGLTTAVLAWLQWGPNIDLRATEATTASGTTQLPQLQLFNRAGRVLGTVGGPADYSNPALSPDGRQVAVSIRDSAGRRDIWVFDLVSGTRTHLTSDSADETNPVWSPDGRELAYCSDRAGQRDLYARPAAGGPETVVLASDRNKNPMEWARDGSAIYYNVERPLGGHEIWRLPVTGTERSPAVFLASDETHDWVALSPDSRWVLYRAGRGTDARVTLRKLLLPAGEWPVGGVGVLEAHWRADGKQVYFISGETMMAQDVKAAGDEPNLAGATPLFRVRPNTFGRNAFAVTPKGDRFLVRTGS